VVRVLTGYTVSGAKTAQPIANCLLLTRNSSYHPALYISTYNQAIIFLLLLCVGCVCQPLINEHDDDDDDDVCSQTRAGRRNLYWMRGPGRRREEACTD